MPFPITTGDIEAVWRPLSDAETDVAFNRLREADTRLRLLRPALLALYNALAADVPPITIKADLLEAVRIAIVSAVIRFLRNPDVVIRQDIGADGSIGIGFDTQTEGGVYIADGDLAAIDAAVADAAGSARARVGSQRLTSTWPWRTRANSPTNNLPTP